MKHCFRLFGDRNESGEWTITAEDKMQLIKVLRMSLGEPFEITDGKGHVACCSVASLAKKDMSFDVSKDILEAPRASKIRLAVGALKPKDFLECLPRLVELGVDDIIIFGQSGVEKRRLDPSFVERSEKVVKEALKVAKRSYLPTITVHGSIDRMLAAEVAFSGGRVVAQPNVAATLGDAGNNGKDILCVVGGERGLDETELDQLFLAGFKKVCLGPYVLRATTALISAAALLGQGG